MTMLQANQIKAFIKRQDFHDKANAALGSLAFGSLLGGVIGIISTGIGFLAFAALSSAPVSAVGAAGAFMIISVLTSFALGVAAAPTFVSHQQDIKRISKKAGVTLTLLGAGVTLACALFAGAKAKHAYENAEKETASITADAARATPAHLTTRGVLAKALASAQQRSDTPAIVTLPVKKLRMVQSI